MKILIAFALISSITYAQERTFKIIGTSKGPSQYCYEGDFPPYSEAEYDADEKASASCNGVAKRISDFEYTRKCTNHFYLKASTMATAEYECEYGMSP